jgi:hypothetical protein
MPGSSPNEAGVFPVSVRIASWENGKKRGGTTAGGMAGCLEAAGEKDVKRVGR